MDLNLLGANAKQAARLLNKLGVSDKNKGLVAVADALKDTNNIRRIIEANCIDIKNAVNNNMKDSLIDRLSLNESRIIAMADGIMEIVALEDPVGEVTSMKVRPNGLNIGCKRVPLGVVGIIYESRPNVTADAFGLCFKTGNAVILRGGSDAINSNTIIVNIIREALKSVDLPEDSVLLITDTSREVAAEFMRLNRYVDVLIPRGGAGLIKKVVETATIPVIETGTGNCHIYVDAEADIDMAADIVYNAKTQRLGVCNTCESLLIHKDILSSALPVIADRLRQKNIELRGDDAVFALLDNIVSATEEDWGTEYLDAIISIKTVNDIDEAIDHINTYNTGHSEAIVTKNYDNAMKFLNEVDAAAVYVNASTRFTDGNEFGFGAEIGISTQKLHARGPMGLNALTTTKYIIFGNGQIRP
ncbi:MAG: glutamate-5-semialdehyde dehydrogenase [Lachnospiraceae bacterium]|nr:glutamate-5-semialdehyde dehydrogenase [Lachnospiraceae bacterium]